jgi:PAS domain S-box-containing protein
MMHHLTIRRKLILFISVIVLVSTFSFTLATIFLTFRQTRQQNETRLKTAIASFNRDLTRLLDNNNRIFSEFEKKRDIAQEFRAMSLINYPSESVPLNIRDLARALNAENLGYYFQPQGSPYSWLSHVYAQTLRGTVAIERQDGSAIRYTLYGQDEKGLPVRTPLDNIPKLFPETNTSASQALNLEIKNDQLYLISHIPYKCTFSDEIYRVQTGDPLGFFVVESKLGLDLTQLGQNLAVQFNVYTAHGDMGEGELDMPSFDPRTTPHDEKLVQICTDKAGQRYDTILAPIEYTVGQQKEILGYVGANISQKATVQKITEIVKVHFVIALVVLLVTIAIMILLVSQLTKPIQNLTRSTSEIAAGKLEEPIPIHGSDELGVLAQSFNHMRDSIRQKINDLNDEIERRREAEAELQQHKERLEELVEERTRDLVQANQQLQLEIVERQRADEALVQERNLLRTLIDILPTRIFVKDRDARYLIINSTQLKYLGLTEPSEALGRSLLDILQNEHGQQSDRDDKHVMATGQAFYNREEMVTNTDGTPLWLVSTKVPLLDLKGDVIGLVGMSYDITERKLAEQELARHRDHLEDLVQTRTQELVESNAQLEREVLVRRQAEQELARHRDHLQDLVAERTADLNETNRRLQDSLARLQQTQAQLVESEKMSSLGSLVAGIAHEINTPVGIGVTAASHLEQETREISELFAQNQLKASSLRSFLGTARDSSNMILSNLMRAADLIQSFKKVAVDQSSQERRVFNLRSYMDEVLLSLRPKLKKTAHTITINCPDDLSLDSYPGAFSQVITNLVMNSLIHGFENIEAGQIRMDIEQKDGMLHFRYSDNGKGIPSDFIQKVFDPFFTTRRGSGGSGLGLHILYNLVTQTLGGHVNCVSEPGVETVFTIVCPLCRNNSMPVKDGE